MSLSHTDEFILSVKYKGINYYNLDIKINIPSYKMLYKFLFAISKR